MLSLQKYLRSGKTPEDLKEELGIKFYEHPSLPLVGFKYHQIDSPKTNEIVRECRGIVLEKDTWNLVAKGFNRFFNIGEHEPEYKNFNWKCFVAHSKEDGSLILVYKYKDQWCINSSGSFGLAEAGNFSGNWQELFWKALGNSELTALCSESRNLTYVFELCTPYNKTVRQYKKSELYLLSAFDTKKDSSVELSLREVDCIADDIKVKRPKVVRNTLEGPELRSELEVSGETPEINLMSFLQKQEEKDPTFEGLVCCDNNGIRFKWKTDTYISLHRLRGNGNVLLPKNLVPICLAGEVDEVLVYTPEITTAIREVDKRLKEAFEGMVTLWEENKDKGSQKQFAMAVRKHPLSSFLFKLRKQKHSKGTKEDLKKSWRESGEIIAKRIFGKEEFEFDIEEEQVA